MPIPLTERPHDVGEPLALSRTRTDEAKWPLADPRLYDAKAKERMRWAAVGLQLRSAMQRCNPILAVAMAMTVAGWSLMWAQALLLLQLMPLWVTIATFGLGLALIPFGSPGARTSAEESVAPTRGADPG